MTIQWGRTLVAGVVATTVMTVVGLYLAPMMHIPRMNPAAMLAGAMGGNLALGWLGHYMVGTMLAVVYATLVARLRGAPWQRGAYFGIAPWLLAQLVVIPMMGMPLFSGSVVLAGASLVSHVIYGAVVGAFYGAPAAMPARTWQAAAIVLAAAGLTAAGGSVPINWEADVPHTPMLFTAQTPVHLVQEYVGAENR